MSTGLFRRNVRPSGVGAGTDFAVLGLANPGSDYLGTRHNVGGEAVNKLAERLNVQPRSEKGTHARLCGVTLEHKRIVLAIAETFMNDSGLAAAAIVSRYLDDDATRLIVVHDELDLAPGVVRIKVGGGTAGHNGLRSIEQHAKRLDFCRVRIGIGKPQGREQGAKHVLSRPNRAETELLAIGIERAADAVELIISDGIDRAMTIVNKRQ